ncbi:hypothetical protein NKI04_33820, partial [Mesorhizobium sp. M0814]
AISNSRLIALDEAGVTFRVKDYRRNGSERYRTMTTRCSEIYLLVTAKRTTRAHRLARSNGFSPRHSKPDGRVRLLAPINQGVERRSDGLARQSDSDDIVHRFIDDARNVPDNCLKVRLAGACAKKDKCDTSWTQVGLMQQLNKATSDDWIIAVSVVGSLIGMP